MAQRAERVSRIGFFTRAVPILDIISSSPPPSFLFPPKPLHPPSLERGIRKEEENYLIM